MMYLFLGAATAVALIGFIKWKICAHAVLAYFAAKGHKLPDSAEQKKYYEYVIRKLLRLPARLP